MTNTTTINFRADTKNKMRIEKLASLTKRPASFFTIFFQMNILMTQKIFFLTDEIIKNIRTGKEKVYTLEEVEKELSL